MSRPRHHSGAQRNGSSFSVAHIMPQRTKHSANDWLCQLSIGVLSTMFVGSYLMMGGKKAVTQTTPPIKGSSKDEENFIQYVTLLHERVTDIYTPIGLMPRYWTVSDLGLYREFLKSAETSGGKNPDLQGKH